MRRLIESYRLHNFFYLCIALFFVGCNGDIYSKVEDESYKTLKITKLELSASDPLTKKIVKELLQKQSFTIESSEYKLFAEHRSYKNSCNNTLVKSTSNTSYDGLVSIILYHKENKIYTVYMDYRGDFREALFKKLLSRMIDDLNP